MTAVLPWVIPLDAASATPVYVQVAQGLEQGIGAGAIRRGSALPAERELAHTLGVSRVTVRQALAVLAERGLLVRRHGSGTFVSSAEVSPTQQTDLPEDSGQHAASGLASRPLGLLTGFSDDIRSRGLIPGARVLRFERGYPTPQEAMTLALSPTEGVIRLRRLRTASGEPLAVEDSTLPAALAGDLTLDAVTDASLYALLAARGLRPHRAIRHLRAVNADAELAALLDIAPGAALIATERVSWTAAGRPIEHARAHYRGDRYDFVMELQGGQEGESERGG
ncbi:GntR family transcriptional regulator [Deinococcus sp. Arct2-2]|uniref:GntR family transcriptional regulator n=1 Tax=Deinococcus sp. Arct2-2 TaxID=2568653 RepID=UPI001454B89B|nr:GntR family transcriptional regulator [Deinococcus sp. Arct2-2]